ncbi:hypothetical protein H9P43_009680 [Blastocladiella emersonii ATCC 22665]|nr:hypothetical protein H9P43_009680 [Blastocladiella emersonii ATCC 22665]
MDLASARGQLGVLDWLVNHDQLQHTLDAIVCPVRLGLIDVLRWWESSEWEWYCPKLPSKLFEETIRRDDPAVLNWLRRNSDGYDIWSGLNDDVDERLAFMALQYGSVKVLEACVQWLPLEHFMETTDWGLHARLAIDGGEFAYLRWIYDNVHNSNLRCATDPANDLELHGVRAIKSSADRGDYGYDGDAAEDLYDREDAALARLEWWKQSGAPLKLGRNHAQCAQAFAHQLGFDKVAEWWAESGLEKKQSPKLNRIAVLDRLKTTLPPGEFSCPLGWSIVEEGDDEAAALARLEWWKQSGVPLKLAPNHVQCAQRFAEKLAFHRISQWWRDFDLEKGPGWCSTAEDDTALNT